MPKFSDVRLTNARIRSAKPGETLSDAGCPGLSLRVTATGRRVFSFRYRIGSVQKRITIGEWSDQLPLEVARARALAARDATADGRDPGEEKRARKSAFTFQDAADLYLQDRRLHCRPGSIVQIEALLRLHILPHFGGKLLREISRADVSEWMIQLGSGASKITANRSLIVIKAIFFKMIDLGRFEGGNPCSRVKKYKESNRERFLTGEERGRLERVLADVESGRTGGRGLGQISRGSLHAIRLLALTGARKEEIASLSWSEVDLERGFVHLGEGRSKTGKRSIPLTPQAIAYLRGLHDTRETLSPYVCAGVTGRPPANLQRAWVSVREAAGLHDVRIHDLRHSFASDAIQAGIPLEVIAEILGHSQIRTTQRYAHLDRRTVQAGLEKIGQKIADATATPPTVIPLRRGASGGE